LRDRLRAVGVQSLQDLKSRLDKFVAKKTAGKAQTAPAKIPASRGRGRGGAAHSVPDPPSLNDEHTLEFLEKIGLSEETLPARAGCKEGAIVEDRGSARGEAELRSLAKPLLKAIQALHSISSSRALRMFAAASETEDQRALQRLQRTADEFMPVLAAFRECAVDRAALSHLGRGGPPANASAPVASSVSTGRRRLCGKQRPGGLPTRRLSVAPGPTARRFSSARSAAGPPDAKGAAEVRLPASARGGSKSKAGAGLEKQRDAGAATQTFRELDVPTPLRKRRRK